MKWRQSLNWVWNVCVSFQNSFIKLTFKDLSLVNSVDIELIVSFLILNNTQKSFINMLIQQQMLFES